MTYQSQYFILPCVMTCYCYCYCLSFMIYCFSLRISHFFYYVLFLRRAHVDLLHRLIRYMLYSISCRYYITYLHCIILFCILLLIARCVFATYSSANHKKLNKQVGPLKRYYCYFIISGNKTYNGYTVDLNRRLRQHNGEIKVLDTCDFSHHYGA